MEMIFFVDNLRYCEYFFCMYQDHTDVQCQPGCRRLFSLKWSSRSMRLCVNIGLQLMIPSLTDWVAMLFSLMRHRKHVLLIEKAGVYFYTVKSRGIL